MSIGALLLGYMSTTKGLQFKKMDLHVHTPASGDYQGGSPTPAQIVKRAHPWNDCDG